MDVTFDIDKNVTKAGPEFISPATPDGYRIAGTSQDITTCTIEYENASGELIVYSQDSDIDNMSLSIDNEDADFKELTINGHKGYSYEKEGLNALFWTDGGVFLYLAGNLLHVDPEEHEQEPQCSINISQRSLSIIVALYNFHMSKILPMFD